jgi:hypothetical protein
MNDESTDREPGEQKSEASPIPRESSSEQDIEAAQGTVEISGSAEPSTEEVGEQTETPSDETTVEGEGTEQSRILPEAVTAGEGAEEPGDSGTVQESAAHTESELASPRGQGGSKWSAQRVVMNPAHGVVKVIST